MNVDGAFCQSSISGGVGVIGMIVEDVWVQFPGTYVWLSPLFMWKPWHYVLVLNCCIPRDGLRLTSSRTALS